MNDHPFANRLHSILSKNGITQGELAARTQISVSTISRYLNGTREPGNDNLIKISFVLKTNPSYLKGESNIIEPPPNLREKYYSLIDNTTPNNLPVFSQRLNILLKVNEYKSITLAKKLNLSKASISRYINGVAEPSLDIVVKIAHIFNVSTDYLTGSIENDEYITMNNFNKKIANLNILQQINLPKHNLSKKESELLIKLLNNACELFKILNN